MFTHREKVDRNPAAEPYHYQRDSLSRSSIPIASLLCPTASNNECQSSSTVVSVITPSEPVVLSKETDAELLVPAKENPLAVKQENLKRGVEEIGVNVPSSKRLRQGKVGKTTQEGSKGRSKSAIWQRRQNAKLALLRVGLGNYRFDGFEGRIHAIDSRAQVLDPKTVRHVKCGKSLQMKSPFNTHNFRTHVERCTGSSKSKKLCGAGMSTIDTFFQPRAASTSGSQKIPAPNTMPLDSVNSRAMPCPGLTEETYPQISGYLNRTGARGGGAPSVTIISGHLYGKKFSRLSSTRQAQVRLAQSNEWKWEVAIVTPMLILVELISRHCQHIQQMERYNRLQIVHFRRLNHSLPCLVSPLQIWVDLHLNFPEFLRGTM